MLDDYMQKIFKMADKEIEDLVFDSLKRNNFIIQEAIKNPSKLTTIHPAYGLTLKTYITRNIFYILNKLDALCLQDKNESKIRVSIRKEILYMNYLSHKRYLNSNNPEIKKEYKNKIEKVIEELTDLNDSRVHEIKNELSKS